ncbi:MAG: MATE family efflux transporter, partial [Chlamydiia bacterium]|nr:MATE family efflux transporter [Chlamydiia bacterium]
QFRKTLFLKCLRVGAPPAFFVLFELLGWATFYMMMERISSKHILVASITQSILLLFLFFGLGLEKGAAAIAGNLIGGKKLDEVKRLFWSGIKLSILFGVILAAFLGCFSDKFINLFFMNPEALTGSALNITPELLGEIKIALKFAMITLVIYLTLENVRWLLSGLLTAAGDTLFPMFLGLISIWCFMLAPTYFFVLIPQAPIERALNIWVFYSLMASALFLIRFVRGKWKEKNLISGDEGEPSPVPRQDSSREMGN